MRKRSLAALCTAAALGFAVAMPTAAHAADPYPEGFKAWSEDGRIYLDFEAEGLPKDLKVHLRKPGTETRVATVTAFEFMEDTDPCSPSCQDDNGEPARSEPLRLADLGTYSMDVEYDGTLGETVLHEDKADFDYGMMARVTRFEVTGTPDFEHRTVGVKADAVVRDPRTDVEGPLANGKLVLETSATSTPVATDATGHVETSFAFAGTEIGEAQYGGGARLTLRPQVAVRDSARARTRMFKVLTRPTALITLDTAKVIGPDGSQVPVSGRVTYKASDGTMKPVPAGLGMLTSEGYVRTGADGRFTAKILIDGTAPRNVWINSPAFLAPAVTSAPVDPSTSAGFHGPVEARVGTDKKVDVTGTLYRYDIPARTTLKVEVQFRAYWGTAWTTKRTLSVAAPAGNGKSVVTATALPYPGAGNWRLRYVAAPGIPAGPVGLSAVAGRSFTAIPEFNANPEPVKAGSKITLTGKLTHKPYDHISQTWAPYSGQRVHFYFREAGSTSWTQMGSATTREGGIFKQSFTAGKDGTWKARLAAVAHDHFKAASREDFVDVQ